MANQFLLLKQRKFLPLFITQFMASFNDSLFKCSLSIFFAYRFADNELGALLIMIGAGLFIMPFVLFSHIAGQLCDKYEKSSVIRYLKIFEVVIAILSCASLFTENAFLLLLALFLFGTQSAFFGPVKYSILPSHLRDDELIAGNGLIESGTFISILLGTIIGGLIQLDFTGKVIVTVIILATSVIGLIASYYVPFSKASDPKLKINPAPSFIKHELTEIVTNNRAAFLSILGISWFWMIGSMLITEIPVYVKQALNSDSQTSTFLYSIFSLGVAIGTIMCNRLMKGKVNANYTPVVAFGMSICIFDLSGLSLPDQSGLYGITEFFSFFTAYRVTFDLFALAICGGIYIVPLYVILQKSAIKNTCSRIIASNNFLNTIFIFVYSVFIAILIKINVSLGNLLFITACLNTLVTFYMCKLLPEKTIKFVLRQILNFLYEVELKGTENYQDNDKKTLIIANHTSFLDALLIGTYLPGKVTFAVNTQIAKKFWLKPFFALADVLALDPTNPMALKYLIKELDNGKKCVIFPEGRITVTGSLMKVYEGAAMVADKTKANIVPIRIDGASYSPFSKLKGRVRIRLFPKITITILPNETINLSDNFVGRERRAKLALMMYDLMSSMVFAAHNYNITLFESLLEARNINGGSHKIIEDINRQSLSYNSVIGKTFILGRCLSRVLEKREYVGILLPNMNNSIVTFFALQSRGCVPAMLNYSAGIANIISACKTTQLKKIITSRQFIEKANLHALVEKLGSEKYELIYLEDVRSEISIIDKITGMLASYCPGLYYKIICSAAIRNADNPCVILFTSGSEGIPKAVVLSHKNIATNRGQLSSRIDFGPTDIVFNALPIFHSFGLTAGTLLPLFAGVKIFFYPSPLHYRIVPELVYDTNATIMFGTCTFLGNYAKYAHPYDFYSIRYVFSGAERLKQEVYYLWLEKFGVKIFEGYGATETSPIISTNTPMHSKFGSVGRIMPGMTYELETVPGVSEGKKLLVTGDNVMLGYILHSDPGVIVPPENKKYDTGDIVEIDDEDYIYIKGRAKRFAKIAGEMVSLTSVENLIEELWPNCFHGIISVADAKKGEQLILATTNQDGTRSDISNYIKERGYSDLSLPKKIIYFKKLPLLGSGKIDYVTLKDEILKLENGE